MSSVLAQLALTGGAILFLIALGVSWLSGVPLLTALFRAVIVMCLGSVVVAGFFRYFTGILYRFIDEKMREQARQKAEEAAKTNGTSTIS
jgi:hypothetical protein